MIKISLCMIVKDEEAVLKRCLKSAKKVADEIVIVDTGSSDNTINIAKQFTEHVYSYLWQDDFAAARNFAFSKGTGDYLLWLDADDVIYESELAKLTALKSVLERERPDVVFCPYSTGGNAVFTRERFLRKEADFQWQGRVHECVAPRGKIVHSDFTVTHLGSDKPRGARNLHIYQKWAAQEQLSGRDLFYYGRELYYNRLFPEAEAILERMLAGDGWYVNKIEACKTLALCRMETGDREQALRDLFRSFLYGEPRASVLCKIAEILRAREQLREAAFWYEAALSCKDFSAEGDFEEPLCRSLIPLTELTCCYYSLGDTKQAIERHKRAEELFPEHPSVIFNRKFFQSQNLL